MVLIFFRFSAPKNTLLNLDYDGEVTVSASDVSQSFTETTYKNGLIGKANDDAPVNKVPNKSGRSSNTLQEDISSSSDVF